MISGRYSIHFDRMGFPLIQRADWPYAIALLPVSKYQFERFMIEHGPQGQLYTDEWYRERLALNPRASWRHGHERPWELFITGVERAAVTPFSRYLGPRYRLPTAIEWRSLWHVTRELQMEAPSLLASCRDAAPPLRHWLAQDLFPLTGQGLLEWVTQGNSHSHCCIGRPYPGLLPNTWSPGTTREVAWEIGRSAVGFRMVMEVTGL